MVSKRQFIKYKHNIPWTTKHNLKLFTLTKLH